MAGVMNARTQATQRATDGAEDFHTSAIALTQLANSGGGVGRIHAAEVDAESSARLQAYLARQAAAGVVVFPVPPLVTVCSLCLLLQSVMSKTLCAITRDKAR